MHSLVMLNAEVFFIKLGVVMLVVMVPTSTPSSRVKNLAQILSFVCLLKFVNSHCRCHQHFCGGFGGQTLPKLLYLQNQKLT